MIEATRRWFRRNRTNLFVGAGVIGAGYIAGQYVLGKIQEARQRLSEDRIAKENLRRRFQQNQEDCTYTVLALLPTVRDEIIGALPVEQITEQLQQERQERLKRLGQSEAASTEYPSVPPSVADEDGSKSASSGSFVHASQMDGSTGEGAQPSWPKKSKAQLWQDMKLNSITRALTLIYTLSLLTLFTRIQLNLLGRRTYLSSVVALANPPAAQQSSTISLENRDDDNFDVYGSDFETNRKYLTFSWWLLHRGSKQIMNRVMAAVKEVFGQVNIREDLTFERIAELVMAVRRKVEGSSAEERLRTDWLAYLVPPRDEAFVVRQAGLSSETEESPSPEAQHIKEPLTRDAEEEAVNGSLRRLLDETADLIESPTSSQILTRLFDAAYSHLVDYHIATEAYQKTVQVGPDIPIDDGSRVTEVTDVEKVKLAHVLPVFCRQAHAIAAGSSELEPFAGVGEQDAAWLGNNEYLTAIDQVHDLEAFAAVIYSSNFEYEVAGPNGSPAPAPPRTSTPPPPSLASSTVLPEKAPPAPPSAREPERAADGQGDDGAKGDDEVQGDEVLQHHPELGSTSQDNKTPAEVNFEAAWKKALAEEDGQAESQAPIPVPDE